jgi:hypothetical protein
MAARFQKSSLSMGFWFDRYCMESSPGGAGGKALRPANAPIFIGGKGAAGTVLGLCATYRQTSGLGRLGIYL